ASTYPMFEYENAVPDGRTRLEGRQWSSTNRRRDAPATSAESGPSPRPLVWLRIWRRVSCALMSSVWPPSSGRYSAGGAPSSRSPFSALDRPIAAVLRFLAIDCPEQEDASPIVGG